MGSSRLRDAFPTTFLLVLLALSVATNLVFVARQMGWHLPSRSVQIPAVTPSDHIRGDAHAAVTIVEYGDFQCPFCATFHASMVQLSRERRFRWVYRHFPLTTIHASALQAAEAAECAGDQGRFWQYADALFQRQQKLSPAELSSIAADVGIDAAKFGPCLASEQHRQRVLDDAQAGGARISGTPTFYINGKRFEGVLPLQTLEQLVR
jgi:protein-disulfide isomerase